MEFNSALKGLRHMQFLKCRDKKEERKEKNERRKLK
jgi:hypothetical protein